MTASMVHRAESREWEHVKLEGNAFELRGHPVNVLPIVASSEKPATNPEIHCCLLDGAETWVLLVPHKPETWVSGRSVTNIQVLRDRDSIWWPDSELLYFSTEKLAAIEPFQQRDESTQCIRCCLPIEVNHLAVQCPGCGLWHHQDASLELECWCYHDVCGGCGEHPTDLNTGYRWVPESARR